MTKEFAKNPTSACRWEYVDALQPPNPGTSPVTPFARNQALPDCPVFVLGKVIVAARGVGDDGSGADSGRGGVEPKVFTFVCAGEIEPYDLIQVFAVCPADMDGWNTNHDVEYRRSGQLGVQAGINDKLSSLKMGR